MTKRKDKIDYTGMRFGKLTCVENLHNGSFLYKCDCGKSIEVEGYKIHYRKSCGCLYHEAAVKRGEILKKDKKRCIYCGDVCKDKMCRFCSMASKNPRKIEMLYKQLCLHGTSTITVKKKIK